MQFLDGVEIKPIYTDTERRPEWISLQVLSAVADTVLSISQIGCLMVGREAGWKAVQSYSITPSVWLKANSCFLQIQVDWAFPIIWGCKFLSHLVLIFVSIMGREDKTIDIIGIY